MTTQPASYWALDFPGLTEDQANELVQRASKLGVQGVTLNPSLFLTISMDRDTAEALSSALADKTGDPVAQGLLEAVQSWLASTQGNS
jgi:transaldolase